MAETVTINGQSYLKRNPLGVLGLSFITIGVYWVYWFYKVNQEIKRFENDDTISPARSTWALFPGGILIVPAVIAVYNTGQHILKIEQRRGLPGQISPALMVVLHLVFSFTIGLYGQEHLNRIWDAASTTAMPGGGPPPSPPPAAPPPPPPMPVG